MAHLVEVQHERGASGGQTFHSLLTASLPPRRGIKPPPPSTPPHVTDQAELLLACVLFLGWCQPPASGALILDLPFMWALAGQGQKLVRKF